MFSTLRNRSLQQVKARGFGSLAAPAPQPSLFDSIFKKSNMPVVPLNLEFPGIGNHVSVADSKAVSDEVKTTTLSNGLRVVSVNGNSPLTSICTFIDSGSRYEGHGPNGINSFMETIAFKSTPSRSDFRLVREMLNLGCNVSCAASRESIMYSGDGAREHAADLITTLSDVIRNNEFDEVEMKEARELYKAQLHGKTAAADHQIMEAIHSAGYYNNTLGLPFTATEHGVDSFTGDVLRAHRAAYYTPNNMVVSAVGIDHSYLVQLVEHRFGDMVASKETTKATREKADYTGGDKRLHRAEDNSVHVALAFETANWHHADLVPMCVLQMMMGGGGSFSAGGPGKGMYSRLYTNLLNRYNWVESATCFNSIFDDTALFGFYGSATPDYAANLAAVMLEETNRMAGPVNATELKRAKNQLKSAVQMHLEVRRQRAEDIGRQMLTYGKIQEVSSVCAQIEKVTEADIRRVAQTMLKTPLSVAAVGDLTHLPRYDLIASNVSRA